MVVFGRGGHNHGAAQDAPMNQIRPGQWWPRYRVELSPDGRAGIRDSVTDVLHPVASVEDAHVDAAFVNAQDAAGNTPEVVRHLAFVAEMARSQRRPEPAPTRTPSVDLVLASAAEWSAAREAVAAADVARARESFTASLRIALQSASAAEQLAAARVADAVRQLYARPEEAQRVLADTSHSVPHDALAALVRSEPAVYGPLVEPNARRFGPAAAAQEIASRIEALALAIEAHALATAGHDAARAATDSVREPASASPALPDPTTPAPTSHLAPATRDIDHRQTLARSANRLRALLAVADEKTKDAVLRRFPGAASIARESRATSLAPEF